MAEYDLNDDAGKLLLKTALESFDRLRNCHSAIKRDGEMLTDPFEQLKPHPLLAAERDARSQLLAALKALNLDTGPLDHREDLDGNQTPKLTRGSQRKITPAAVSHFREALTLQDRYLACLQSDNECGHMIDDLHCAECRQYLEHARALCAELRLRPWEADPLIAGDDDALRQELEHAQ